MLHNLAVELGHRVTVRVAVVDDSVEVVQLAALPLRIETCQVLRCHQMGAQTATIVAYLARGRGWDTDYVGAIVNSAEDLEDLVVNAAS